MTTFVQLITLAYCLALIVGALQGVGPLHDTVASLAVSVAVLAVIRQVLVIVFSQKYYRRQKEEKMSEANSLFSPRVSIIMPAYNEGKVIRSAIESMLDLSYSNYEILLIDDGSSDDTYDVALSMVSESGGRLRVYRQPNSGKSTALNLGLRISRSPYVLCVDADSEISSEGIASAVRHFHSPQVAAVAGVVKVRQNRGAGWLLSRLQSTEYMMSQRLTRAAIAYFKCIPIVPGPAGMFRRQALVEAGGYRNAEECFAEDAELSIRLLSEGYDIVSEPRLISVTEAPSDMFSLLRQRYRWSRGSIQALFLNAGRLLYGESMKGPVLFLYLLAETVFFPTLCFGLALFFLANTVMYGQVTDFAVGLMVLVGLEVLGLFLVSESYKKFPVYLLEYLIIRFFYAYVLTAWTLMCMRDEMSAVEMTWDKLERRGVEQ